ncbi:hypothetical protein HD806DRAFT_495687 [Xylariaceae sp. AK1471]|nr:hypothetical protein HD806DRAFT_495687 [Xylariaceae sp. AK1471]
MKISIVNREAREAVLKGRQTIACQGDIIFALDGDSRGFPEQRALPVFFVNWKRDWFYFTGTSARFQLLRLSQPFMECIENLALNINKYLGNPDANPLVVGQRAGHIYPILWSELEEHLPRLRRRVHIIPRQACHLRSYLASSSNTALFREVPEHDVINILQKGPQTYRDEWGFYYATEESIAYRPRLTTSTIFMGITICL